MLWTFRITFLLFLAWIVFMISPFVALYDLAKAVEARDAARIGERVNIRALRVSLSRQIVGEYLKTDAGQELSGFDQQSATNAGTAIVNPVVEQLVTPEALIDMLADGWPDQVAGNRRAASLKFDIGSIQQAWTLFVTSQSQGFRSITIPVPANVRKERQFKLTLRLSNLTWRLTGLELPVALRQELIKRVPRATE